MSALAGAFTAWVAVDPAGHRATIVVNDLAILVVSLLAAVACRRAQRRGAGRAWGWLGGYAGMWAAGQGIWTFYELVLGRATPFPSLADVCFLAAIPLALVGLLTIPSAGRLARLRFAVDGAIVAGSLVGAGWSTVLAPIAASSVDELGAVLGLVYPVSDIILVVVGLAVAMRVDRAYRYAMAFLIAGITAVALTDAVFGALAAAGRYGTGHLLDVGWFVAFILIALGAHAAVEARPHPVPAGESGPVRAGMASASLLPVALLPVAAMIEQATAGGVSAGLIYVGCPVTLLVLARALLVNVENAQLNERVSDEVDRQGRAARALEDAQRLAALGSWDVDMTTEEVSWSNEFFRLLGYQPGEVQPEFSRFLSHVHPADRDHFLQGAFAARASGTRFEVECRVLTAGGDERWMATSMTPVTDGAGELVRLHGTMQDITDRHVALARLDDAQRIAHLGSWEWDPDTGVVIWSEELYRIFGLVPSEFDPSGDDTMLFFHPDDRQLCLTGLAGVKRGVPFEPTLIRIRRSDGEIRWLEARASSDRVRGRQRIIGTALDVTDLRRALDDLMVANRRFEKGFTYSPVGVVMMTPTGTISEANQSFGRIVGRSPAEVVGRHVGEIIDEADSASLLALHAGVLAGDDESARLEVRCTTPDGGTVWADVTSSLVRSGGQQPAYFFVQVHDITPRKIAEVELAHLAWHDTVTGLANRSAFSAELDRAVESAHREGIPYAVLFVDIDRFKDVNDSLGHAAGDELLELVAGRMCRALRSDDLVARLGGDEFGVLLTGPAAHEFDTVAVRLLDELRRPLALQGRNLVVTASIGVATHLAGIDRGQVLRNADAAMYAAKRSGRGRHEVFRPDMHHDALRRLELEADLRRALTADDGELAVHYQPVVGLDDRRIVGVEALLRWTRPDGQRIRPDEFIAVAEETGLIAELGRFALQKACSDVAAWQARNPGGVPFRLSVNISPRQLEDPGIVADVASAVRDSGLDPASLVVEVTETLLMNDPETAVARLQGIKALGAKIAIDDFGTGYSSLSYLQRFPVDILKIDRSFIAAVDNGPEGAAITHAIVKLSQTLGLHTVAEGIETEAQLAHLVGLGCPFGQGFLFSPPVSAAALTALLDGRSDPGAATAVPHVDAARVA